MIFSSIMNSVYKMQLLCPEKTNRTKAFMTVGLYFSFRFSFDHKTSNMIEGRWNNYFSLVHVFHYSRPFTQMHVFKANLAKVTFYIVWKPCKTDELWKHSSRMSEKIQVHFTSKGRLLKFVFKEKFYIQKINL